MLHFAFRNLLSRPVRTGLAIAGLVIAVASMTVLFAVAAGIQAVVQRTFQQIPGLGVQERGAPIPLFSTLPAAWGAELRALPGVGVVDPETLLRVNMLDDRTVLAPPRFLLGLDLQERLKLKEDIYRSSMVEGRFLTLADRLQKHCLISRQVATDLKKSVGQSIQLNGMTCTIVGIYHTGSLLLDVNIILDRGTLLQELLAGNDNVSIFYVEPTPGTDRHQLKRTIEDHFRGRSIAQAMGSQALLSRTLQALFLGAGSKNAPQSGHSNGHSQGHSGSNAGGSASSDSAKSQPIKQKSRPASPVEVRLAEDWAERFDDFTSDLKLLITLITTMGLSIAILSIVNTMMMSVTERTIEFGVLRANGWSQGHVLQLMTLESAVMGMTGGCLGAALGWAVTLIINRMYPERLQLQAGPGLLLFAAAFSTLLGVLGGLYPAWLAARRSPMDAIRRG